MGLVKSVVALVEDLGSALSIPVVTYTTVILVPGILMLPLTALGIRLASGTQVHMQEKHSYT